MASTVQTPVYTQPPTSFARHQLSSSMNGSFSQPALHSFDSNGSVALTPSATPPPRPTPQQQMSFNMSGAPPMNGSVPKGGTFGGYGEINGHTQPPSYYGQDAKPQIYTVSKIAPHLCAILTKHRLCIPTCLYMRWKSTGLSLCADDLTRG